MSIAAALGIDWHVSVMAVLSGNHSHASAPVRRPEAAVDHDPTELVRELGGPEDRGARQGGPGSLRPGQTLRNCRPRGGARPLLLSVS
eukprot:4933834-Pyramimonas_sp.AAC.1